MTWSFMKTQEDARQAYYKSVKKQLQQIFTDANDWREMYLAVTEAIENASIHGNESDPQRFLKVGVVTKPSFAAIAVCDQGKGFDPKQPVDREASRKKGGAGWGLEFMKDGQLIVFNVSGNQVILMKGEPMDVFERPFGSVTIFTFPECIFSLVTVNEELAEGSRQAHELLELFEFANKQGTSIMALNAESIDIFGSTTLGVLTQQVIEHGVHHLAIFNTNSTIQRKAHLVQFGDPKGPYATIKVLPDLVTLFDWLSDRLSSEATAEVREIVLEVEESDSDDEMLFFDADDSGNEEIDDEITTTFLQTELPYLLDQLHEAINTGDDRDVDTFLRTLHTLKGSAGTAGFQNIEKLTHSAESAWKAGTSDLLVELTTKFLYWIQWRFQLPTDVADDYAIQNCEFDSETELDFSQTFQEFALAATEQ